MSYENRRETLIAYGFLAPVIVCWLIWFLYPTIRSFSISFYDFNYMLPDKTKFIGLDNYKRLFADSYFYTSLKNSLTLVFVVVPLQSVFALVSAILLNSAINNKMRNIYRTVFYMPYVISPIAVATVFMYLFVKNTPLIKLLSLFGAPNVTWFANVKMALPFLCIIYIWQQIGFYMVVYLGGLQSIPGEIIESARIDGAKPLQYIWHIVIPMLSPITYFVLTYGMINAFQIFDQVAAIARGTVLGSPAGATNTLVSFMYSQSFRYMEMGYGSAAAVIIFLCIFVIACIQNILKGKEN